MKRSSSQSPYELEALEPRILLSAESLAVALETIAPSAPDPLIDLPPTPPLEESLRPGQTLPDTAPSEHVADYDPSLALSGLFDIEQPDVTAGDDAVGAEGNPHPEDVTSTETDRVAVEELDLSATLSLETVSDDSQGLLRPQELADSRLCKSVYDHFSDATDPPANPASSDAPVMDIGATNDDNNDSLSLHTPLNVTSDDVERADAGAPGVGLRVDTGQRLVGSGTLTGDVLLRGTLSPGHSPGIITIDGDLTVSAGDADLLAPEPPDSLTGADTVGLIDIEIAGIGAAGDPDGYDQIIVTGNAALGGTLRISLLDGFVPTPGDTFEFLTFDTLSGGFDEVVGDFDLAGGGVYFEVVEQPGALQLVAADLPVGSAFHRTTADSNRMAQSVEGLASYTDQLLSDLLLGEPTLTGQMLPGTGVTIDDLFGIRDYFDMGTALSEYLAPIQVLGSDTRFEIGTFISHLRGSWLDDLLGGAAHDIPFSELTYAGTHDWISGITISFDGTATYDTFIPVGLGEAVDGIGPALSDRAATVDAAFAFTLTLDWSANGADYGFDVQQLNLDATLTDSDLVIPLRIGDLEAAAGHPVFGTGDIDLDVHLDLLTADDAVAVTYDPLGDSVSGVTLNLPITATLAGVDVNPGPPGAIDIAGDLFLSADGGRGTTAVAATGSNLDAFSPFAGLRLTDIQDTLTALRDDFLAPLVGHSSFNVDIPFIDASLADVVDLGTVFDMAVLQRLDFSEMHSLQDFVSAVTASGLLPDGDAVTYDAATMVLNVPLDFAIDLGDLSLRDLDALGLVTPALLDSEGLIQIGDRIDPDDLLDGSHATLADLWNAGVLGADSVENWNSIDASVLIDAGIIGPRALDANDLVGPGNAVNLDDLIDLGLVTFGELAQAGIVTAGSLVGKLGFIRDINLAATNVADLGLDLVSQASVEDLVPLDDLLSSGLTNATLDYLFDNGLLGLGDIDLDALGITELIDEGTASLQDLVSQGLVTATDFLDATRVDITDLLNDPDPAASLAGLLQEGLVDAGDFLGSTPVDAAALILGGIADLSEAIDEALVDIDDFLDVAIPVADILAAELANTFELEFNDLIDLADNVSLHDLANSGVVSLEELVAAGLIDVSDFAGAVYLPLSELLSSGVAEISELVDGALVDAADLLANSLNLEALLNAGLVSLETLVNKSLVSLSDLVLDEIDLPGLIESGLADLGDLVRDGLLTPAQVVVDELLASDIAGFISGFDGLIGEGAIIDLDALLAGTPVQLHHLIYFGLIDHNDVRPLGTVDADVVTDAKVIDASLLERRTAEGVVADGYLTLGDLIDLGQLARENLADLPLADLDDFGFSTGFAEALDADFGLVVHGDAVAIDSLVAETDLTLRDLLRFGLIDEGDLQADLSSVLLDDVFVMGTVDREDLLASDLVETPLLGPVTTQNAQGKDVAAIADITAASLATLGELIASGLLSQTDFDIAALTVSENDLLAAGLVTPNKLDNNDLVQSGNPDVVAVSDLVALGLVSLGALVDEGMVSAAHLDTTHLLVSDLLAADVVGDHALAAAGLGTDNAIDLESLIDAGLVTLDELVENGVVDPDDLWDDSVVTLRQLEEAGLVDISHLAANTSVDLDTLMDSDVVSTQYVADSGLDADDDDTVPIEDLLLDPRSPFEEMVRRGLLRTDAFINKVFEQGALEAITVLNDAMETVPLFEDGELDWFVYVGAVPLNTLLSSILYDVTLSDYVTAEFVDVFDFTNIDLTVADLESTFAPLDIDDAYTDTIPLYSFAALDDATVSLVDLIASDFLDDADLADPAMGLDIRALERSDLFEFGDLNNYITAYEVYLYDLTEIVYIGDLVDLGLLSIDDLIVRNFGLLADLINDGVLDRNDFDAEATLSAAALTGSGLITTADLNAFNLVDGDDVSLRDLVLSDLLPLDQLITAGLVDETHLADTVTAVTTERIHRSDIFDMALVTENGLVTGAESDAVILTDDTDPSLLSTGIATLTALVRQGVVEPSHLRTDAQIDKDDLIDADVVALSQLITAGLIAPSDILPAAAFMDLKNLDDTGALPLSSLTSLDRMITLGLIDESTVDGFGGISGDDLVSAGLATEDALVDAGLFGTHIDLASLISTGLVTVDELKDAGLDDRSGRVALADLLDAAPALTTLTDLQAAGVVNDSVAVADLLDAGLVSLTELMEDGVDKALLLATALPDPVTEQELIDAELFTPRVPVAELVDAGLATVSELVSGGLVSGDIDLRELITLNLVSGEQLVDAGILSQANLDAENFLDAYLVSLLTTDVSFQDGTGALVSLVDLAAYGFFDADIARADLIASGLTDGAALDAGGFLGIDPINPRALIASALVTEDALAAKGLITGSLHRDDILAAPLSIVAADLIDAGLLADRIDAQRLVAAGLVTDLSVLDGAGLLPEPLIARSDLDDLGTVGYDSLDLDPISIDRLLAAGLVDADGRVDLDELLDTYISGLGAPLIRAADLARMGLIDADDLDGYDPDVFGLSGHEVSLAGDYGVGLVGLVSDAQATLDVSVAGTMDVIFDLDDGSGAPGDDSFSASIGDMSLTAGVSFIVTDLDVPARLGLIGVTLASLPGASSHVSVSLTRTVILDGDGNPGTTGDRVFAVDDLVNGVVDPVVSTDLSGNADAALQGIAVDTGLGGLGVARGTTFHFSVDDLGASPSDSGYITMSIVDLPGIFRVYEFLRLDDLMATILRARDYILEAFDQLPFFVTDPNSPIYEDHQDVTIPIIEKTPRELLGFLGEINDAIDRTMRALLDPENDLQKLIGFIMDKLGLDLETDGDVFSVAIQAGVLVMSLKLEEEFEESLPFEFDLAAFTGLLGGVAGLDGIGDLVDLEGSGIVTVKAFADVQLKAGVDASGRGDGSPVDIFLFDWDDATQSGTRAAAGFKLLAQDISLGFEVFDAIGLRTNDAGLDWDRDGVGGNDGILYTTSATIDADGDASTNPELIDPDDRSDFVTVAFVLDQQSGTGVTDDGRYRFDETLIGDNVVFTGVDGGLELFMPLTIDVFGTEIDLSTPLWMRTNPAYDNNPIYNTDHNVGLEQIFLHLFSLDGAGTDDPVLIDGPDFNAVLGDLVDSVIKGLLEDLAALIGNLKAEFLSASFFDLEIPGTGRTIASFVEGAASADNGLPGVATATGLEAFLDIDTYVLAYLETVTWIGENSVATGHISVADIWSGLADFLRDHWMITLPGIGAQGLPGFFTVGTVGDELTLSVDIPYTISDTLPIDLGTDLDASGLSFDAALDVAFDISTGLSFDVTVDLTGKNSSFDFNEIFLSAAVSANDIDLGISYETIELTTHVGSDYGDIDLAFGGSIYQSGGSLVFDHAHNKAGDATFNNGVTIYLPLAIVIDGVPGVLELGHIQFGDDDFYDGELDPGFSVDLQNIGGILTEAAYLVLDFLGQEITDLKGDLVPIYDPVDGSEISSGNDFLSSTIPGTDVSLNRVLGLDNLMNLGEYIRHYLRPHLGDTGFERDAAIPLGNPGAAGESGTNYYGPSGPTLGGFFDYLQAYWIPTLGGEAGGLSWDPIMDGGDVVGVDLTFTQDFPFERVIGFNFGEEAESIGLSVDGDMEINLAVNIDLAMGLSFNWDTDTVDFDIDHLNFDAHASADDIVVGAEIGPLRVALGSDDCEKGRLALDLGASMTYIDEVFDFTPTPNTASENNNFIDAYLPVYASLGDVTFGGCHDPPRLMLSGTIFPSAGGPELSFSQENMDQLLDFSDFNLGSLIAVIQSTLDWLGDFTNSDFMSYEVPIIGKTLGELFDFASSFTDKVVSNIDFERINSVQDFIEQFTDAGILPPGLDVVYDPVSRALTLPVNFGFDFNDLNLRTLQNLGDIDYGQLLDLGAIDPDALFNKDTILGGLLDMLATPLDELARWDLVDADFFNPSKTISIAELEALELIEPGALAGGSILLTDLLTSEDVSVDLQTLFETDLLSAADFVAGGRIDFDDLMASRLISLGDLVSRGVTLYDAAGAVVEDPAAAATVDLASLLGQTAYSLTDAIAMGFLSEELFDLTTSISIADLETAELIEEDALDSLGLTNIYLGSLLASDLVSVTLTDLLDAGLVTRSDVGEFDLTTVLTIADLETDGIIDEGALDDLGDATITLGDLLDSDLVNVDVMDLVTEGLINSGDVITSLGSVAGQALDFEGFDLPELVDMGMLTQGDIVDFEYDLISIKDLPIDLGIDLGDVLELGFTTTADAEVTVEAGFEWVVDFDGLTGEEGVQFLINNARVAGRASLALTDPQMLARLGFIEMTAGGPGSGLELFAEAIITLDEDGDLSTDNDRQFSFTDLVTGGLIDHFVFDFTGFGEARLIGINVEPDIPGLNETGLNAAELSITIPDILNWDVVEVVTQGEATEAEIDAHLGQDHVVIVLPDFGDAFSIREMDFAAIIQAIRTGVEFIESALEDTSFYDAQIPIINRRISEAFTFVEDLLDKIELAAEDPAAVLQEVEALIEDALGITDTSAFGLSLDGNTVLKVHIEWDKFLSDFLDEEFMNLSFSFNLGDFIALFSGGDSSIGGGWDFINELVAGGANISWDAFVEIVVDIGIDFSDILEGDVDFFIYDHDDKGNSDPADDTGTRVTIGLKVEGTDLELMFNPFGIGVTGGSAHLGVLNYDNGHQYYTTGARVTSADFATFTMGIDQQSGPDDDGRFHFFSEDIGDNFAYDLKGGFDIYLPLQIPLLPVAPLHVYTNNQPDPAGLGEGALLEALRRLAGTSSASSPQAVIVELPAITVPEFSLLSILNDPSYILDGVDWALGAVQDVLGSSLAQDIPLVGDKLYKAATFLRDLRTGFLADLREKLSGPGAAIKYIRDSMWDVFGPSTLNILRDADGNGVIEKDDIGVGWYDENGDFIKDWKEGERVPGDGYVYDANGDYLPGETTAPTGGMKIDADADAIQFDIPLGGVAFGTGIDIPLDIDVPAFGLQVDGGFAVELSWSYEFSMGLSVEDGFYLGTNDKDAPGDPELEVEIGAFLDGEPLNNAQVTPFYAEGKLLFFILSVEDIDRDDDRPGFQPSGVFGFLEVDLIGDGDTGRMTLNRIITSSVSDIFHVNLGIEATLNLTLTLDIGDVGLPRLKADFVASWAWDLENGAEDPEIDLYNLRIEVGTFITDVLKPITDKISDILMPFKPIVDVLLTEISGLDVLVDPPNLLGLINLIARTFGYSELPEGFFNAVRSMIEIVDQVDAMIGTEGEILLGDIMGLGTDNVRARQAESALPAGLQSFMDRLTSDSTGGESQATGVQSGGSSTDRSGFEIVDYILDISNWMKLITGGDAILFTYELPYLEYELTFRQGIATITAGPAVINVYAVGGFNIGADLGFGYDTYGIKKAIQTGNWWQAFDGFYIADWGITSGVEKDELTFGLEIGLEATLWLLLVEAGLGGVVGFEAGLDLQDINDDGRIHPSELATMWTYTGNDAPGGLLNIINLHGRVYFEAYVFVDVGISIPIVGKIMKRVVDWTIFDITIAEWEYNAPKVQPVLAHDEGGELVIHTGKRAGQREYLDTDDGGEQVTITGNASSITVAYDEWEQTYTGSFTKVVADGGAGDDVFDASGLSGVAVAFDGGIGDDRLTAGSGAAAELIGGDGDDTLSAVQATGMVIIDGGAGDDRITGGTGATNTITGGDGDDRIVAGDGDDIIDGGAGLDSLTGMGGNDTYIFASGFGEDRFRDIDGSTVIDLSAVSDDTTVTISSNSITINTASEELRLGRAQVTQLILGTGYDTLLISDLPEGTIEIVDSGGGSHTTFTFSRNTNNKADGIISFLDSDGAFDEVIFENIFGIEADGSLDDIIVINDHEIRNGKWSGDTILNARDVFRFTDDVEQITLVAREGVVDSLTTETTYFPINLTVSTTVGTATLGATDVFISAQNLTIRPNTTGGSMHLDGDDIVIDVVEDAVLDTSVHATGDFYIDADSIGTQLGSASPLVRDSADALGIILHEIDAHDLNWDIRVSSMEVNAQINAISDGNLVVYTANTPAQAYIDLNVDITSASGDNRDNLGGGIMRFVAEGVIRMDNGMRFEGAGSHLILAADNITNEHYAGSNRIETTVGGITVLTRDEGVAAGSEIVIEETDSLVVIECC